MPIYEYYCQTCGKEFELMRPFSESDAPGKCPSCGTEAPKLPSVFASNEGYSVKVPRGPAYRGREQGSEERRSGQAK
jgi:putative FmdB family regulatory protein